MLAWNLRSVCISRLQWSHTCDYCHHSIITYLLLRCRLVYAFPSHIHSRWAQYFAIKFHTNQNGIVQKFWDLYAFPWNRFGHKTQSKLLDRLHGWIKWLSLRLSTKYYYRLMMTATRNLVRVLRLLHGISEYHLLWYDSNEYCNKNGSKSFIARRVRLHRIFHEYIHIRVKFVIEAIRCDKCIKKSHTQTKEQIDSESHKIFVSILWNG